jgi:endonuclease YncB( thermonuclease family)
VPWHTESRRAQFKQVIDAVTISVEIENQPYVVRYIGLSPPGESSLPDIQALAEQANRELVEGQDLLLIKDRSETDSEGRLLRYVIAGGVFVNLDLVGNGYAQVSVVPPDNSCDYLLREAAASALANQRGMWSSTPTPTRPLVFHPTATVVTSGQVIISFIQPEGSGWLDPDEFVEFNNISGYPIQMQDWKLRDLKGHTFVFPEFTLYGGNYCRIYTNAYRPEHCGLSFYSLSPIWDNRQDCAYLYDRDGYLVDEYCYGW